VTETPLLGRGAARVSEAERRPGLAAVIRVELSQLLAHPRTQVAALTCLLAPLAFVIAMGLVSAVPSDTLFGRWVRSSGMAVPLVVLGFAGQWGIPALMSLVAGDAFAGEDRHGTWPGLMTRSTTRGRIFAARTVAAAAVGLMLVTLLGASSVVCGRVLARDDVLLGLSGQQISGGLTALVVLAWLTQLLPALTFGSLALMLSVLTRSTAAGTGVPVAIGLVTSLAGMAALPEWLRELLPGTGFEAWHGLFAEPGFTGPLLRTSAVGVTWTVLFLVVAWRAFSRRDVRSS
jgi:ABC-2 type transport system permease protein